jgi:hypothetical protein
MFDFLFVGGRTRKVTDVSRELAILMMASLINVSETVVSPIAATDGMVGWTRKSLDGLK